MKLHIFRAFNRLTVSSIKIDEWAAAINRWTPAINRLEENQLIDESINCLIDLSIILFISRPLYSLVCYFVSFYLSNFNWPFLGCFNHVKWCDFFIMRKVGLIGLMIVQALPFNTALGVGLGIGLTVTFCLLFCTYPIRNIDVEVQFSLLPSIGWFFCPI